MRFNLQAVWVASPSTTTSSMADSEKWNLPSREGDRERAIVDLALKTGKGTGRGTRRAIEDRKTNLELYRSLPESKIFLNSQKISSFPKFTLPEYS